MCDKEKEFLYREELAEALGIDEDAVPELVDECGLPETEDKSGEPIYIVDDTIEWLVDRLYGVIEERDEEDEE